MGERNNNNNNNNNKGGEKNGDGENKEFMFFIDYNCKCCANKIIKFVGALDGVETVKPEINANKLTVIGNVDPLKIQEKLHHEFKKTLHLISPQPKKDDDNNNNNNDKKDSKQDEKKTKEKEATVKRAVLKLNCACEGCVEKIKTIVKKTKGVQSRSLDKQNKLVTVEGTMDVMAFAKSLQVKLKRPVEIVRLEEKHDNIGGDKNDCCGDNNGGCDTGKKKNGGGRQVGGSGGTGNEERNKMDVVYGFGFSIQQGMSTTLSICIHPSDMNPNSCSIICC